jgi:hypothetical protein
MPRVGGAGTGEQSAQLLFQTPKLKNRLFMHVFQIQFETPTPLETPSSHILGPKDLLGPHERRTTLSHILNLKEFLS